MSTASFKRWRRRPGLSRPLFSAFDLVLAQNVSLAERFAQLGVARTLDVGNLKADAPPPPADLPGRRKLDAALPGRTVWLAASTHPGEDETVMAAHLKMQDCTARSPDHHRAAPSRARAAHRRATPSRQPHGGASLGGRAAGGLDTDIYVADTIGELGLFYALAPVAFVGGSLADRGGQNPVEAIKLGAAVLTGPNWQNFRDSYSELLARRRRARRSAMRQASPRRRSLCSRTTSARRAMTERAQPRHCRHERRAAAHAGRARTLPAAKDDLKHAS